MTVILQDAAMHLLLLKQCARKAFVIHEIVTLQTQFFSIIMSSALQQKQFNKARAAHKPKIVHGCQPKAKQRKLDAILDESNKENSSITHSAIHSASHTAAHPAAHSAAQPAAYSATQNNLD